ncbi:MAG: large subunit ribosomal protein L29 [archaeon GW2011_AR3]|nr:MAG: large subunit ribosomal protein L29 [archaeon GW2011_AR3]MBS3109342.1 50S ribosomal protein L29 [Candidatus Woesearchaeota archaeon]
MKFKEIKAMDREQLNEKMAEVKKDLIKSNAQVATGTVPKSPGQIRQMKKTVAKIMTAMNQKMRDKKE